MRLGLWITLVMIGCATLVGCADRQQKCGNKVLTLWPSAPGQYSFQEILLTTLSNPYSLSGAAAKVYYQNGFDGGYSGKVAEPRYTTSGDTCVPMDAASSLAVSMYAQMEHLMRFESRLGTLDMLTWPRSVGVDIHVTSSAGDLVHNNAHYIPSGDIIAVVPYTIAGGLPIAANLAIVAHEHFHSHFQRQVNEKINVVLSKGLRTKPIVEDVESADLKTETGLNVFVMRAWNEGLADLYGAIYSGSPRFFDQSLPMIKEQRDLMGPLKPLMSAESLQSFAKTVRVNSVVVDMSYGQGTLVARLLYRLAMAGVETPETFLVRVLRRLPRLADHIGPKFDNKVLEFEEILTVMLDDFPRNKEVCDILMQSVSKNMLEESFGECSAD